MVSNTPHMSNDIMALLMATWTLNPLIECTIGEPLPGWRRGTRELLGAHGDAQPCGFLDVGNGFSPD